MSTPFLRQVWGTDYNLTMISSLSLTSKKLVCVGGGLLFSPSLCGAGSVLGDIPTSCSLTWSFLLPWCIFESHSTHMFILHCWQCMRTAFLGSHQSSHGLPQPESLFLEWSFSPRVEWRRDSHFRHWCVPHSWQKNSALPPSQLSPSWHGWTPSPALSLTCKQLISWDDNSIQSSSLHVHEWARQPGTDPASFYHR